jgi:predicted phosphodiesterase
VRYAIVSDIHANLQAWNAVLSDIATQQIDRIICLGDSVGYGPDPSAVLTSAYQHVDAFCMGNHDAVICGKLDPQLFNAHARQMIEWTRSQLSEKAVRFLGQQPLTLSASGFRCSHGDFTEPAAFHYITDSESAAPSWDAETAPLLFVGHTHVPTLFVIGNSGKTHELEPQPFVLEPGKRYLVNPGSVGNPRSGDALATYCTYNSETGSVRWQRVPFDLDAFRTAIRTAGLDESNIGFLALDPRRRLAAVRESVDFSPARNESEQAHGVTAVSELEALSKRARRWKRTAVTALAVALIGMTAAISYILLRPPPEPVSLRLPAEPLVPAVPASVTGNWLPPFPATTDGQSLDGWRVELAAPDTTLLSLQPTAENVQSLAINVAGDTPARFRIESVPVRALRSGLGRFTLLSRLERPDSFRGTVQFAVEQLGPVVQDDYAVRMRETKDPPPISPRIQFSTDASKLIPDAKFVRLVIEGEFTGQVIIEEPSLSPRP